VRLMVTKKSIRRLLCWGQRVFFSGAVLALGYCGFILVDTWIFQNRASRDLESRLHDQRGAYTGPPRMGPAASPEVQAVAPDGLIGRIEIPRIGLSAVVFQGIGEDTLRVAVGHIPGTVLPGQLGNAGLAGHRDTFFRPLRSIIQNDLITVTTLRGEYRYRVVSTRVVGPVEVSVLGPTANETLTLVTCYPFKFVGAAPNRFVVFAERVKEPTVARLADSR
jgi:sortase A